MHQYLDSDGSGTNATCVSSTIGAERIADATNWLKTNNKKGFLGEMGAGSNGKFFPIGLTPWRSSLCQMYASPRSLERYARCSRLAVSGSARSGGRRDRGGEM